MAEQAGRLAGKVAIVTGAGGGFGEGIAKLFAQEGARVGVLDLRGDAAEKVAGEIGENARIRTLLRIAGAFILAKTGPDGALALIEEPV
jgi:NAD(P)-dependent dehydrogenase (short-subunit alcohol dehydrogenase family)